MDWRVKLIAQKIVANLPAGMAIHEWAQREFGKFGQLTEEGCRSEICRGLDMLRYARNSGVVDFAGGHVLELGTGWHGADALLFYLTGARRIVTIDAVRHLDLSLMRRMGEVAETMLDEIADAAGTDVGFIEGRYDAWARTCDLDELEAQCGIAYRAPASIQSLDDEGPFDVFYSYSVLQRLRIAELEAELRAACLRLADDGSALHVIHHSDLNARHDDTLNRLAYLRYPDWLYERLQTDLINYQNRLRSSEIIEVFEMTGYRVVDVKKSHAPSELLEDVDVADCFRGIPASDLRCTRSQVLLRPIEPTHQTT